MSDEENEEDQPNSTSILASEGDSVDNRGEKEKSSLNRGEKEKPSSNRGEKEKPTTNLEKSLECSPDVNLDQVRYNCVSL